MKKRIVIIVLLISGITLLSNCKKEEAPAAPAVFDMAATKTTIEAGYKEFEDAFNAKDSVRLAGCYASDAKFMNPNAKAVEGRANIQKQFAMWFKGDTSKIKLNLVDVWGNENNVIAENAWTISDKDGKVLDEGKSIEVYKMEDGKWKLLRDCYNSNMPAMPMAK